MTDYFDGMLARRWGQTTDFGRFLDPIADKLLVGAVLVMMIASGAIAGATVVAALADLAARVTRVRLCASFSPARTLPCRSARLAKWKTGVQLVAIALLSARRRGSPVIGTIGAVLLWVAAGLTVYTGYDYLRGGLAHMTAPGANGS